MRSEPWKNMPPPVVIATNPGEQAPHAHHPSPPGTGLWERSWHLPRLQLRKLML